MPGLGRAAAAMVGILLLTGTSLAQLLPSPGPVKPPPPVENPVGKGIVINPTEDECRRGWDPSLKWTKEQFNDFCGKLGSSK